MPDSSPTRKWTALHDSDGDFAIYDQDEKLVAVTDGETQWDAGNAALMQSAPAMLQALEATQEVLMDLSKFMGVMPGKMKLAYETNAAAIKAAKGAE